MVTEVIINDIEIYNQGYSISTKTRKILKNVYPILWDAENVKNVFEVYFTLL